MCSFSADTKCAKVILKLLYLCDIVKAREFVLFPLRWGFNKVWF